MSVYRVARGSMIDRFRSSRAKIKLIGGGYANGKTAGACCVAIELAKDYPGSHGLVARATYAKLNDTIRIEFKKWLPPSWIKSDTKNPNDITLKNGSLINFRYISQRSNESQDKTSNLLSATYDWIVVDQIDDPEITRKDYLDLQGRLRGSAPYKGSDSTMPASGPRWLIITCNPTGGWVYKYLAKPYHEYMQTGVRNSLLPWDEETNKPFIELFEGSTYENYDNLPSDFVSMMEASYSGQMKERYIYGLWSAYEGLVHYPFNEAVHVVSAETMDDYFNTQRRDQYPIKIVEGYDYGMSSPSCYLLGFTDYQGNIHIRAGYYKREATVDVQARWISEVRKSWLKKDYSGLYPYADPAIFVRTRGNSTVVGESIAELFRRTEYGITMQRGNNNIPNGIQKVNLLLTPNEFHINPYTGSYPAPHLYVCDTLDICNICTEADKNFFVDEIRGYRWKRSPATDEFIDTPSDVNDHAMDALKYMTTHIKEPFEQHDKIPPVVIPRTWQISGRDKSFKAARYGRSH